MSHICDDCERPSEDTLADLETEMMAKVERVKIRLEALRQKGPRRDGYGLVDAVDIGEQVGLQKSLNILREEFPDAKE